LEVVRRVGKDQIDGILRQRLENLDAIAVEDRVNR
jgi:hypothetical protein